jgi:signal transduction histidine kinase/CheY-like chemotaxis protein
MSNLPDTHLNRASRGWNSIVECKATDPDLARQGRILAAVFFVMIVCATATGITFLALGNPFSSVSIDFIAAFFLLAAMYDNRRGNVIRAAITMVIFSGLALNCFFIFVAVDDVSRSRTAVFWIIPVVIAASILSWEFVCASLVFGVLNTAVLQWIYLSERPILDGVPWSLHMASTIVVLIATGALCIVSRYQTDRYQRELRNRNADLDRANDLLESEVQRRTQDLVVARDLALSANRVKSDILVNMSHELRTPMNSILGNADILLDAELTPQQRECADDIRTSGRSLLVLIDGVLEYSDLDMGATRLDERPLDIRAIVKSATTPLLEIAKTKNLSVNIHVDANVPERLITDGPRLRRVIANLVGNGIKFTDSGSVDVSLESFAWTDESFKLRCVVRDTGIGIPQDRIAQIFETFEQVDGSLKRRMSGVGLGLALSKRLVERMGGKLVVSSEPGKGSCFTFDVQVKPAQEKSVVEPNVTASAPRDRPQIEPSASPTTVPPCTILLAEDNVVNQKVALAMLKKLGYIADLANNGVQAVQATEKKHYDIILMDVQMPEMDGLEATRTILSRPNTAGQPVIIGFTAHILAADKEQCYAAGMTDIVAKPTELAVLREALLRAMAKAA